MFSNNKKFDRTSKFTCPGGERRRTKKFKKDFFRAVAAFTLISFLSQQCLFAQGSQQTAPPEPVQNQQGRYTPVITPEQYEAKQQTAQQEKIFVPDSDDHFIQNDHPLQPAEENPKAYQTVEEAADLIRNDFAYATIVDKLSERDLKTLINTKVETGLIVIDGEIVLFTSGSNDEIRTAETAADLFDHASLIAHFHPLSEQEDGPSGKDIEVAVRSGEEYVITENGVYAYNSSGIKERISYSEYISRVTEAAKKTQSQNGDVRQRLNQFIADTDALNYAQVRGDLFRAGGTISPNLVLAADAITTLPGKPDPILTGGSYGASQLVQAGAEMATIAYDVSGFSSFSGVTLNYDNFGTPAYESVDLSAMTKLVFGISSDADQIKFEIEDAGGHRDTLKLINVTADERIYEIDRSLISAGMDFAHIRFMNFIVDSTLITNGNRKGNLSVRARGLGPSFVNKSPLVDVTSFMDMTGNPAQVVTAGSSAGTWINRINSEQVDLHYDATATYGGLGLNYDSFSTPQIETFDLSLDPVMAIGLKGDPEKVRLEIQDATGKRVNLSLEGISSTQESFYKIDFSQLAAGLDLKHVTFMNFVEDKNTNGAGLLKGILSIRYGTFVPDTTPPAVAMTSPVLVKDSSYTLAYTVDGKPGTENVILIEGQNTLHRVFSDISGNQTVVDFQVTLDTIPPVLVMTSPALTNQQNYLLVVTVDGTPKTFNQTLVEGNNAIVITETDAVGNQAQMTFNVTLDTVPPVIAFTSPILVNQANYILNYTLDGIAKTKNVSLVEGVNSLTVTEQDVAGNQTTQTYNVTLDTVAPTLNLVSSVLVNNSNYTLQYQVDGAAKTENLALTEGANVLTRTETDAAGNQTTSTWVVTLDTVPPVIAYKSPALVNDPHYQFQYYSDGVLMTKSVALVEGENVIPIVEHDLAGNETRVDYTVTLDTIPPQITFTSATLVNQSFYNLVYTVDGVLKSETLQLQEGDNMFTRSFMDPAGNLAVQTVKVTLDTIPPDVTLTSAVLTNNPSYALVYSVDGVAQTENVALAEGDNLITRTFTDPVGNKTTKDFWVKLDTIPPQVMVSSPALVNNSNYTLTYTSDGVARSQPVTLTEGDNIIPIVEHDAAGNETRVDLHVTLDTIAPLVVFNSPTLVNNSNYSLAYTSDGQLKQMPFTLNEGLNTLNVVERDLAGNETKTSLVVMLDTIPPRIAFTSSALVNNPNYSLQYTADGQPVTKNFQLAEGDNVLAVTETDAAGNVTNTAVTVTLDTVPPQIAFTSPVLVNNSNYALVYTSDGQAITKNVSLVEGDNVLSVTETDAAGNVTNTTLMVTLDTVPPVIAFTSPILVNDPNYALVYTSDGQAITKNVSLVEGDNLLSVTETDAAGNTITATQKVTLDTVPPVIAFTSPILVNDPNYALVYTSDGQPIMKNFQLTEGDNVLTVDEKDAAGNETKTTFTVTLDTILPQIVFTSPVLVNNANYALTYTSDGQAVTKNFQLAEGNNVLAVTESDAAGNVTNKTFVVTLDTVPPQIQFTSPVLVNKADYQLTYMADGQPLTKNFQLAEGNNVLSVTETDLAGNNITKTFIVTLDTVPPQIAFTSPTLVNNANYSLAYTADGQPMTKNFQLTEGGNILSVTETDLAGNNITKAFAVTLDTIPPQVQFTSPTLVNNPNYMLTYTSDGAPLAKNVQLIEGDNTLSVTETDAAGNSITKTFTVSLDTVPPQIQFTSPALVNNSAYSLIYTVDGQIKTEVLNLTEGENILTRTETDLAGNQTVKNFRVVLDTMPPQVILKSQTLTNQTNYLLEYEVSDTMVGGAKTLHSEAVNLVEGPNSITRTLTDPAGNSIDVTFQITLDTKAPTVALTSQTLVKDPAYALAYTVDGAPVTENVKLAEGLNVFHRGGQDAAGNQWSADFQIDLDTIPPQIVFTSPALVNNANYQLTYTTDGRSVTKIIQLTEGDNVLAVTEADAAGNSITKTFTVTLDTVPPQIAFTSAALVNNGTYQLTYIADGQPVTKTFQLAEGDNVLVVTEADAAGNITNTTFTVTLDTVPPQIALTSPVLVNNANYQLAYTADGQPVTKNIQLAEGANSLSVTETDAAGNSVTKTFAVILDTVPPVIQFTSPALVNNANYLLAYTSDGHAVVKMFQLTEGDNMLTAMETDPAGNSATATFKVTLDTVPPQIAFASPALVNQPSYTLSYTADGQPVTKNVQLAEGNNMLSVTETDAAGNSVTKTFAVTLDTVPPVIAFTSPALVNNQNYVLAYTSDGQPVTKNFQLTEGANALSVTETDAAGNSITKTFAVTLDTIPPQIAFTSPVLVNSANYQLTYTADGHATVKNFQLTEGDNVLSVTETDVAGNSAMATFKVTLDTVPPQIAFTSPALVNNSNYTLNYTADGQPLTKNVQLVEGDNILAVTEKDAAGNLVTANYKVTLDTVPPAIQFTSPILVNDPNYTLHYTADGQPVTKNFQLTEGDNVLSVTETDVAGNQTTSTLKVTLDTVPPQIQITSTALVNNPAYQLTYTMDGKPVTKSFALSEGVNILSIDEKDAAGNQTKMSYAVTLDTIPPAIQISSPVLVNNSNYTLLYTSDGQALAKNFQLVEGDNVLDATGQDAAGNVATVTYKVTLDTVPPQVALKSSTLVNDPNYVLVYTNDGQLVQESLTLAEGVNTISRTVTDVAGNSTVLKSDVTLDTIPPVISIQSSTRVVDSAASVPYTLAYTVDGALKQESLALVQGPNLFPRQETDLAGNVRSVTFTVLLELPPPPTPVPVPVFLGVFTLRNPDPVVTAAIQTLVSTPPSSHDETRSVVPEPGVKINIKGSDVTSIVEKSGAVLTDLVLNAAGEATSFTRTLPFGVRQTIVNGILTMQTNIDGSVYEFSEFGGVLRIRKPDGTLITVLQTDASGKLIAYLLETPQGEKMQIQNDLIVREVQPDGTVRVYDEKGTLIRIEKSDGQVWTNLGFGIDGSLTQLTKALNDGTQRVGTDTGVSREVDPDGRIRILDSMSDYVIQISPDQTREEFIGTRKLREITPDGTVLEFNSQNEIQRALNPDGSEIRYLADGRVQVLDTEKKLIYTTGSSLDTPQQSYSLLLSNGIRVTYAGDAVSELDFPNGIKVLNPQFSDKGDLTGGVLVSPSGIKETVAFGSVIRRELPAANTSAGSPGGLVQDFAPDGRIVRNLDQNGEEVDDPTFSDLARGSILNQIQTAFRNGNFEVTDGSEIRMKDGTVSNVQLPDGSTRYFDANGKVSKIVTANGQEYVVGGDPNTFQLTSVTLPDKSRAVFDPSGNLDHVNLSDGSILSGIDFNSFHAVEQMADGTRVTLENGKPIEVNGIPVKVTGDGNYLITQNGFAYVYDLSGKLISITQDDKKFTIVDGHIQSLEFGKAVASFDRDGQLDTLNLANGEKYRFENGNLFQVTTASGDEVIYQGSKISSFIDDTGTKARLYRNYNARTGVEEVSVSEGSDLNSPDRMGLVPYLLRDLDTRKETLAMETPLADMLDFTSSLGAFYTFPDHAAESFATDPDRGEVSRLDYTIPDASKGNWTGLYAKVPNVDISKYDYISIGLKRDSTTGEPKSVKIELKGTGQVFEFDNLTDGWQDFVLPVKGRSGEISEITVLVNEPDAAATGLRQGAILLDHIAFFTPKLDEKPDWQKETGVTANQLSNLFSAASKIPVSNLPVLDPSALSSLAATPTVLKYDDTGKLSDLKFLTAPPKPQAQIAAVIPENTPNAVVENGRVRQITDPATGQVMTFSYEFDPLGQEITVISDQNTKEVIRLKNGELVGETNSSKITTQYDRDSMGRITTSHLEYQDQEIGSFTYKYQDAFTLITDGEGITRRYDTSGVLRAVINPDKTEYAIVYDALGALQSVNLAKQTLDGATRHYTDGKLSSIDLADGTSLTQIVFGDDGGIKSGVMTKPDGTVYVIENGFPKEVRYPSGATKPFDVPNGEAIGWEKSTAFGAEISLFVMKQGDEYLKYDESGTLRQIVTGTGENLFITPGTDRAAVTYAIPKEVDGVKIPTKEIISFDSTRDGISMHLGAASLFTNEKNLVLMVTDPTSGAIIDQGQFDLSQDGMAMQLALFLKSVPDKAFLMGSYGGGKMNFPSDLEKYLVSASFSKFGLKGFDSLNNEGGRWAFIGRNGAASGKALEAFSADARDFHFQSHSETQGALQMEGGKLLPGTLGFDPEFLGQSALRADQLSDGMTPLASLANSQVTAYQKNFVSSDPNSGFFRVDPQVDDPSKWNDPTFVGRMMDSMLNMVATRSDVYVYFDGRYPSNWISEDGAVKLKSALAQKGMRVIDADQLAQLMKTNPKAAVIMAQDIAPDTVFDPSQSNYLVRDYLKAGGSMVWMHDIPFYYVGHAGINSKTEVGRWGQDQVLNVTAGGSHVIPNWNYTDSPGYKAWVAAGSPIGVNIQLDANGVTYDEFMGNPTPVSEQSKLTGTILQSALSVSFPLAPLETWSKFEGVMAASPLDPNTAIVTRMDENGKPSLVKRADGSEVFYDHGQIQKVVDPDGTVEMEYVYAADGSIAQIHLNSESGKISGEIDKERKFIEKQRDAMIALLPDQEAYLLGKIDEEVAQQDAILAAKQSQLERMRFQTITQSTRTWYGAKKTKTTTVEVPGIASAIAQVQQARAELRVQGEKAKVDVKAQIEVSRAKILEDSAKSLASLPDKEKELRSALFVEEMTPVIAQTYRDLLGRDPTADEIRGSIPDSENVDIVKLRETLMNSGERKEKLDRQEQVTNAVGDVLTGYVNGSAEDRAAILASLGLSTGIDLAETEVTNIIAWLKSRNLHFGDSAYGPLAQLLAGKVSMNDLARETILIDILTGVINPTTSGELVLSLNALNTVAHLHGLDTTGQKVDFSVIASGSMPRSNLIAFVNGNHYVLIKSIADGNVTYFDQSIGEHGTLVTISSDQFKQIYSGVILSAEKVKAASQLMSEKEMKAVQGSFFFLIPIFIGIAVAVASAAAAVVSAAIAVVAAIGSVLAAIGSVISGFVSAVGGMLSGLASSVGGFLSSGSFMSGLTAFGQISGAISLASFGGQMVAQAFGADGLARMLGTISQIAGVASFATAGIAGLANVFHGGFTAGLQTIGTSIKNMGGKIWNGITSIATTAGKLITGAGSLFGNILNGVGQFAGNVINSITSGGFLQSLNSIGSGLVNGAAKTFDLIGSGIVKGMNWIGNGINWVGSKIGNFFSNPLGNGTSVLGGKTIPAFSQSIYNNLVGIAVGNSVAKTLDDIGLDPAITQLATAFATGGMTDPGNFFGGAFKNLMLSGVDETALHLGLSPPLTSALSSITGLVSGNLFSTDPKITSVFQGFSKITPQVLSDGLNYLGQKIGLNPTISSLIATPLGGGLSALGAGLVTNISSQEIFKSLGKAVFQGFALGGAEYLFDSIHAPEILKGFGGLVVSSVIEGLLPRTVTTLIPGEVISQTTTRNGILNSLISAFQKSAFSFTHNVAMNVSTFVDSIKKRGLRDTLDLFIGQAMKTQTRESLYQSTGDIADLVIQRLDQEVHAIEYRPGVEAKEIRMEANGQKVTMVFDKDTGNLLEFRENGHVIEGDIRLGENGRPVIWSGTETIVESDGAIRYSDYDDGKLMQIQYRSEKANLDYYAENGSGLIFNQNGALTNGVIENIDTGVRHYMENGLMKKTEQVMALIQRDNEGVETETNEGAVLESEHDAQGNVVSARLRLSSNATINIDPKDLQKVQTSANGILVYVDKDGKPVMAFDGQRVAIGKDAETMLKDAVDHFKKVPYDIQVPEDGMISRNNFEGNLTKQITDDVVLNAARKAIGDQEKRIGKQPIRQVVYEQKLESPKGMPSGVKATSTIQQILLYDGADGAKEYIQTEFNGGASFVITDKAQLVGQNNPNIFGITASKVSLTGEGITTSAGAGYKSSRTISSDDPEFNGKRAEFSSSALTQTDGKTVSVVFQSQIKIGPQILKIETKLSPSKPLPGTDGNKSPDSIKNDMLERTLKVLTDINDGKPISPDAIMAPKLMAEVLANASGGSLDASIKSGLAQSYEEFFTNLAASNNIQTVTVSSAVGEK